MVGRNGESGDASHLVFTRTGEFGNEQLIILTVLIFDWSRSVHDNAIKKAAT